MTPQTYRKRSLPNLFVEAVQITPDNAEEVAGWCRGYLVDEIHPLTDARQPGINFKGEYGDERASVGDVLFKTNDGGFRVKKPGAFNSLWELNPTK